MGLLWYFSDSHTCNHSFCFELLAASENDYDFHCMPVEHLTTLEEFNMNMARVSVSQINGLRGDEPFVALAL